VIRGVLGIVVGVGLGIVAAAAPALAAERAYELVTPPGSAGKVLPGSGASTPDGNTVCFDAEHALGEAPGNGEIAPEGHCAWRTASGWDTKWVTGPAVVEPKGGYGSAVFFVSSDGSRVAFATDKGIDPDYPGGVPGSGTPPAQSAYMWEAAGTPRWLAPVPEPIRDPAFNRLPLAASEDVTRGLFQSGLSLVPQDTNTDMDVYEWTADGIRLVTRDASGAAVGGSLAPNGVFSSDSTHTQPGTMSRDGSRVFFQHTGPVLGGEPAAQNVFMRDGDEVRHVSPRRGGDTPQDVTFAGASEDGETVYLQTSEQMTPEAKDSGPAIYRYDVGSDTLSLAASDASGGVSFLGLSADGSTLVYRTEYPWNLVVKRGGVTTTLGALDVLDVFEYYTGGSPGLASRGLRIAEDGSSVVFSAKGAFDDVVTPGVTQAYRWSPGEGVSRLSVPVDGAQPTVASTIGNYSVGSPNYEEWRPRAVGLANTLHGFPLLGRVIADDGRVFFESIERLVEADVNDYVDVYEWQDGAIRLISPGTQQAHALYHDNSVDGNTVFFVTSARLIPELDRNGTTDLYAARVGGGFPLPEVPVECEGEACQGSAPPEPRRETSATSGYRGSGNADEGRARLSVAPVSAAQRRGLRRRGRTVLRARATERGVVTLVARAKIAGRSRVVARSVRVVQADARAGLPLKLSKRARVALREKNGLRLVISVRYSESNAAVRRVVVLHG